MGRWIPALAVLVFIGVAHADTSPAKPNNTSFKGYAEAPSFQVLPRQDKLTYYPCSQCHQYMEPNPKPRKLSAPHPGEINHGKGRLWCTNCHYAEDRDYLATAMGEPVDYNNSHLVCGSCHANRHKDWYFGGHGKRVGNWQGERTLYNCAHCHDPHHPAIKPREPMAAPSVRIGLNREQGHPHQSTRLWERYASEPASEH